MKIIFVSYLIPIQMNATSTDITTNGIINGLCQNNNKVILVLFANQITDEYKCLIEKTYSNMVEKIVYVKSSIGENKGKYTYLLKLFKNFLFNKNKYKNIINNISNEINDNTIILSHSPTLDSIIFCRELKRYNKKNKWIQYWSDPIMLSGINPEDYSFKRLPFRLLESRCISLADEIVYGPETLYYYQKQMYPKYEKKMRGVDTFYIEKKNNLKKQIDKNVFLYAGNYYKNFRNIEEVFKAFEELGNNFKLDVYGSGDQKRPNCKNVYLMGRVSPKKLEMIEENYSNYICLMNSNCIQIPGKIFYDMAIDKNIIVITDGKHGKILKNYLKKYDRFILVNNDKESIKKALINLNSKKIDFKNIKQNYSPKKIVDDILNGKKK